jgi:polar amino acid transport system substrate-binding protein
MKLARGIFFGALCALVLALWTTAPASARDTLADIKQRGTLIVGVKTDYKPFGYLDPSGQVVGMEPELAADVARRLGVKIQYVPVVAANRLQFLQQGRIDLLIATMSDTTEREQLVGIVKPNYYSSGADVLTHKGSGLKSWADVRGKKLCAIQGAYYNKDAEDKYGATLVAFTGTTEALNALKQGDCVGFLFDDTFNNPKPNIDPAFADYDTPLPSIEAIPWGVAVAKDDPKFYAYMSDVIKDWHKSGLILSLEKKYGIPTSEYAKKMNEEAKK